MDERRRELGHAGPGEVEDHMASSPHGGLHDRLALGAARPLGERTLWPVGQGVAYFPVRSPSRRRMRWMRQPGIPGKAVAIAATGLAAVVVIFALALGGASGTQTLKRNVTTSHGTRT